MVINLDLIQVAFATGIGAGIGNPIGTWIYKKFFEQKLDKAHAHIQKFGTKIKQAENDLPKFDIDEKINKIIK